MIRFAEQRDLPAIYSLWETCFPDEGGFNGYFFSHLYEPQHTLLLMQENTLCAMLQMLPYTLSVNGEPREITYIYGVCTHPSHRRRGYAAELLKRSFALDKEKKRAASILIPAEKWLFEFYRPFGYTETFYLSRRSLTRTAGGVELPRRLSDAHIPQINALYEASCPPLHITRSREEWSRQIAMFDALGAGVYGWFDGAALTAYAFCWEDTAQEAIGLTANRERGLLNALSRETLTVTAPGSETALGVAKWHDKPCADNGYINLMLN